MSNQPTNHMTTANQKMRALTVSAAEQMELREIAVPTFGPRDILIKSGAVGLCGTDFHIFQGHANYNFDAAGRSIPFEQRPQILGHEFCGIVVDVGSEVKDLKAGDRVVVDQGINCRSRAAVELCEYCTSGKSLSILTALMAGTAMKSASAPCKPVMPCSS